MKVNIILTILLALVTVKYIHTEKESKADIDVMIEQEVPYILKYINKRIAEREAKGSCNLYLNLSRVSTADIAQVEAAGFKISIAKPKDRSKVHLNGLTKISWCHRRYIND